MRRITVVLFTVATALSMGSPDMARSVGARSGPAGNGPLLSDFNGDGFADLAVGSPDEKVGAIGAAGAVNVLYGSTGGLQATFPDDQFWTQDSLGVEDSAEAGDQFGSSLTAADFNGDGFADLAVGSPHEKVKDVFQAGALNVLYGSAAGLQATLPDDQFWTQDSLGVEDSAEEGDVFGSSLAAGG